MLDLNTLANMSEMFCVVQASLKFMILLPQRFECNLQKCIQ